MKKMSRRVMAPLMLAPLLRGAGAVSIGCQTNAWKINPKKKGSFLKALKQIKELGFQNFETGFRNLEPHFAKPDVMRREIAASGLEFFGIHIFLSSYDANTRIAPLDLIRSVAAGGAALGAKHLIVSGAPALTQDDVKRKADGLNAAAEVAAGLKLAYHNHGPEMTEGAREIEGLLAHSNASLVFDAGHAFRTGMNVVAFLNQHPTRIVALHLRDYKGDNQVPLGQGSFPLAGMATEVKALEWNGWVLAEEERLDGSKPGAAAARPAFQALKKNFA